MKTKLKNRKHAQTPYINLDTGKCTACWKCLKICSQNVIGKINLPWHKHAHINNEENCTGCLRCVKECESHALTIKHIDISVIVDILLYLQNGYYRD